jgi:predicted DNA-binding transcriptional regulator YafY
MMNKGKTALQRILLMEALLLWEGRLNNGRLRELFEMSGVRASQWIREFRESHPNWTAWDTKLRSYVAEAEAYRGPGNEAENRQAEAASLARYIEMVGIPHTIGDAVVERILWSACPDLSTPSPRIFALISEAIRTHAMLEITYRSMRHPAPHSRVISPHSLVRAGRRWHVRAYCNTHQDFRDYALGRIEKVIRSDSLAEVGAAEMHDTAWNTPVPVRLVAHPELTPEQESLIRFEYFSNTSSRVETCRGALVSYFIQDIRAATNTKKQQPPDYQLAVGNLTEVTPWLFPG